MSQPVIIIGTGSRGKTALEILQANKLIVYGFLDEDQSREGDQINDLPLLGSQDDPIFLDMLKEKCVAFVALENPKQQKKYIQKWSKKKALPTLNAIHPNAHLGSQVTLGTGNLINVFTSIGFNALIGSYNTIEEQVVVGREVRIGDHVHIEAGVIIGEGAKIADGARIKAGAIIPPYKAVKENEVIPAGTVFAKDSSKN